MLAAMAAVATPFPALAAAPDLVASAQQVRAVQSRARAHIAATERATPRRRFAYYTVGRAWKYTGAGGWAAGYVPGALWSCYQLTGNEWWRERAVAREKAIGAREISAASLNLGSLFYPSYARGSTLTGTPALKTTAMSAARAMAKRYDPEVGAMLSRPGDRFNVIIDSLMKSQLLWWAVRGGASPALKQIADRHALTIARDFVRQDGSTWQQVYYDAETGAVLSREAGAAYSEETTWARGQAWAILGFAAAYRETRDPEFLAVARKVCDWYLANLPGDGVPYWDFGAPLIPDEPRDSSAAAIAASGLADLALQEPDPERGAVYLSAARSAVASLMSPPYLGGARDPSVLLHGTYSVRRGVTDCGLAYGDAFFLEALLRLRRAAPEVASLPLARARSSKGTAAAAADGDLTTKWKARGRATLDLRLVGRPKVGAVRVALTRGDTRAAVLSLLVSQDGVRWRRVRRTMTSGETAGYETLDFAPVRARWVRLSCSGTTLGPVNRLAEVEVYPGL